MADLWELPNIFSDKDIQTMGGRSTGPSTGLVQPALFNDPRVLASKRGAPLAKQMIPMQPQSGWAKDPSREMVIFNALNKMMEGKSFTDRSTRSLPGGTTSSYHNPWANLLQLLQTPPGLLEGGTPEEEVPGQSSVWSGYWGGGGGGGGGSYKAPRWFQDMIMWRF